MQLPFTATQFVGVFTAYNAAIWPDADRRLRARRARRRTRPQAPPLRRLAVSAILAGFWAFTGIGYHLLSFSRINPAARVFAVLFVAQAALLLVAGAARQAALPVSTASRARESGSASRSFAMVGYPLLGFVFGHGFPNGPAFGLTPCPLGIFTFGMLLLADRAPRYLGVIPALWAARRHQRCGPARHP